MEIFDKIIAIDSTEMLYFDEIREQIIQKAGNEVLITVLRNDKDTVEINTEIPETGLIGVVVENNPAKLFELDTIHYNVIQAVPAGVKKTYVEVGSYLKQLKIVFTPKTKAYQQVGSFISIGKLFPKKWDWEIFWTMTALLSIMLAVLNLLPIPALDGGHVMFTLYEMIVGKKPSDKFLERAQMVGMIILLALIVLAIGNDFIRHVF